MYQKESIDIQLLNDVIKTKETEKDLTILSGLLSFYRKGELVSKLRRRGKYKYDKSRH